jgi:hypothetical protein
MRCEYAVKKNGEYYCPFLRKRSRTRNLKCTKKALEKCIAELCQDYYRIGGHYAWRDEPIDKVEE